MTRKQRLSRIKKRLTYDPSTCGTCKGKGYYIKGNGHRSGCAECLVGRSFPRLGNRDAKWIVKTLERYL